MDKGKVVISQLRKKGGILKYVMLELQRFDQNR